MQDSGVLPANGFPHDGGKETRNVQGPIRTWCKHGHLIQRAFGPRRSFRVIPSKRSNETVRIRSGVEEVGVHGTSSEVVVHGVGRGSSCLRGDGSGSSCSRDGSGSRSWRVIM